MDRAKVHDALNKYMHCRTPEDHTAIDEAARLAMDMSYLMERILPIVDEKKK